MIQIRQDQPGLITIDYSKEPRFDPDLHGSELGLGLFLVESGPSEIIAEDSGQLGSVLDYLGSTLKSLGFKYEFVSGLDHALSMFHEEALLVKLAKSNKIKPFPLTSTHQAGIHRRLLPHQRMAVSHALSIKHAANFSVPGSGKTTSALAVYAILVQRELVDRLLVIGPASSFVPWEDEFAATFGRSPSVVRLTGSSHERRNLLLNLADVDLILCTYQMAYRERGNLISALGKARYFLVLDESHHAKNINLGAWARTVLDLAPYAERRMILTGTPAPRSLLDLWSQFSFLWPSKSLLGNRIQFEQGLASSSRSDEQLKRELKPFFVRTKKSDLGLPRPISLLTKIPYRAIPPRQRVIIRLLEQQTLLEAKQLRLSQPDLSILRRWRRARTLRLLQAASNPTLLTGVLVDAGEFGASLDKDPTLAALLRDYFKHEMPAKIAFVVDKVREIVTQGNKVVIWATFVENILLLERLLKDLNPLKIYGDIPPYNEDDDPEFENRERNITDFKTQSDRPILIANPAACSESISLHKVCNHAVYLERTFNCGQFLQSMDRIHRVGMPRRVHPHYHIPLLQCAIEQLVDRRLRKRQQVLYRLLDDDMPVLGFDDDSFLADREDDLEEIFEELQQEIASNASKGSAKSNRRSRPRR